MIVVRLQDEFGLVEIAVVAIGASTMMLQVVVRKVCLVDGNHERAFFFCLCLYVNVSKFYTFPLDFWTNNKTRETKNIFFFFGSAK